MTLFSLRRALVGATCVVATVLASCGGSTIESALAPTRFIAFGDGFSDIGQTATPASGRYTVNDGGGNNIWAQQVAGAYGVTLTSSATGGTAYARRDARVLAKPDAVGNTATFTVKEQVDAYLTTGTFGASDVVLIGAGYSDVIAETAAFTAGTSSRAQMLANLQKAGRDLGTQVRRLVTAGAKYVVVSGTYNLGKSPWASAIGQTGLLADASTAFNDQFLISVVDLGANVLYVDAALQFNLFVNGPASYSLTDATTVVCTSVDAGVGIGTGVGQVNSALCTPNTIAAGLTYNNYLFADRVYPTPRGHQLFGDYAVNRIKARW